jgi:hypothetical protein
MRDWKSLSQTEKQEWFLKARKIIYPDLRTYYEKDIQMTNEIGRSLFRAYEMSKAGGGDNKSTKSLIELS